MGKVIRLKPHLKLEPRVRTGECQQCGHKMNVHIAHPDGSVSCAARGCGCTRRPTR